MTHEFFMQRCIALAKIAKQNGESPVGSVIVKEGSIIAEGIENSKAMQDITFHAEIEAIRAAIKNSTYTDLSDCILYTTHEPCIMCSYFIRHTKIKMVVTGVSTGDKGGYSSIYPLLKDDTITKWNPPPVLVTGILENACREL